jgi:hypothetical protein
MRQILLLVLMSVFLFTGCATNPIVNGKNVGGLVGASGGAYGGSVLCKGCSGGAQIASIGGGALLGWLVGSKVGEYFDERDKKRQVKLVEDVLENNRDQQTSTDTYTKTWRNPNTGKAEQHTVQQSVTPTRTYQQQTRQSNQPENWQKYYYTQPNQYNQMASTKHCREYTIDIKIDKELTGSLEDHKTQYFHSCRSQSGWRSIQ